MYIIDLLPIDVLQVIANALPNEDQYVFKLTCKTFNQTIETKKNNVFYQTIYTIFTTY